MNKFKVEFTLKQHTPIIHFQSEHKGATLRASELKPKFDRFLKSYAFDGKVPKEFKIDKDKEALLYKVKIETDGFKMIEFEKYPPLYFARDSKKKIVANSIKVTFISYKEELLALIKEYFIQFLANENFGTRQSKGYGSFYEEAQSFDTSFVTKDKTKVYYFDSTLLNWEKDIKLFYGFLRAGINEIDFKTKTSKFYAKSLMFLYAHSKAIVWDKKAIKEHFLNHKRVENHHLMKDLLGLSTHENWKNPHGLVIKKHSNKIARYKSPITFKPIQNGKSMRIYFFANQINKEFLDSFFKISAKGKPLDITTPKTFDIEEFFKDSFAVDLSRHIDKKYHNYPSYAKLTNIFKTLKAQR